MENTKHLDPLIADGNMDCNWRAFKQRFGLYFTGMDVDNFADSRKLALLLHYGGSEAIDIFNAFDIADEEKNKYAV